MKVLEIIGNVGRNAERATTGTGRELMKFSVGVTNRDATTTWISVLATYREGIFPYIVKGKQIFVRGSFDLKVYKNEVQVDLFGDSIELLGRKEETSATPVNSTVSVPQQRVEDTY